VPQHSRESLKLDPGIKREVKILRDNGISTTESCQGGIGHAYPEPTITFNGSREEGWKALSIAMAHDLKVQSLRRSWTILEGEAVGPEWEMTFWPPKAGCYYRKFK